MSVVADPDAVSFIRDRGGRLYVWAAESGLKQVRTEAPSDTRIRFNQIAAPGFAMFVADDIEPAETWNVKFHRFPKGHVDVLWDGHQPGMGRATPVIP